MFLEKNNTWKRFNALWKDGNMRSLETRHNRIAILSDIHLGNRGKADNFHTIQRSYFKVYLEGNQNTFIADVLN